MAERTKVNISENSAEEIAYKLLLHIRDVESKVFHKVNRGAEHASTADRKWILDTYAECLSAVQEPNSRLQ